MILTYLGMRFYLIDEHGVAKVRTNQSCGLAILEDVIGRDYPMGFEVEGR